MIVITITTQIHVSFYMVQNPILLVLIFVTIWEARFFKRLIKILVSFHTFAAIYQCNKINVVISINKKLITFLSETEMESILKTKA